MDKLGNDSEGEGGEKAQHQYKEDDREMLKKCSQSLGLSKDYVPDWTSRDAFREFVQNWYVQKQQSRIID